jgi:MinD-like ATPase involved in chromosome partitioning or flagellar assembly
MIIAVCGNSGSGKSTLAVKIAAMFASRKKDTVLIDTDFISPQFNVWFPKKEMFNHTSLAVLLDNNVDIEQTADKMHIISENLGVLGYARDFSANAMPRRPDTAAQLLACLNEMADVIVVDVQTGFINDILSFEVMSAADVRIIAVTPDIKGLSWYDSNIRMMEESWKSNNAHTIRVFNKTRANAPLTEIEQIIGEVPYYLPFSYDVEEQMSTGSMSDITPSFAQKSAQKYMEVLSSLVGEIESFMPGASEDDNNE